MANEKNDEVIEDNKEGMADEGRDVFEKRFEDFFKQWESDKQFKVTDKKFQAIHFLAFYWGRLADRLDRVDNLHTPTDFFSLFFEELIELLKDYPDDLYLIETIMEAEDSGAY